MTKNERIKPGDVVHHFKGGFYKVLETQAYWHEDNALKEPLVVYRSFDTGKVCIRPYDMFMSEVDRKKYPGAGQKYRFENCHW